MDQYAINIHGNSGSVNINFEELAYKLASGEILIGEQNDFPAKKNIIDTINFNDDIIKDFAFTRETGYIYPSTSYDFDLKTFIETAFGEDTTPYNSGVSFVIDAYYAFNHYYTSVLLKKHFAGSFHQRFTFTLYKPNISGESYIKSNVNMINENGVWVEYDSERVMYESILDNGVLSGADFGLSILISGTNVTLQLSNKLQSHADFSSVPEYKVGLDLRIRAFEKSLDDHTIESV